MRLRTGLAALALAGCALLAAGCKAGGTAGPATSASSGAVAATPAAAHAADEVVAAADKLRTTSYTFTITGAGLTMQGAADPPNRTLTMDAVMSIKAIMVDGQIYLKFPKDMPGAGAFGGGDTWLHLDASKFAASRLGIQQLGDPGGVYDTVRTATAVEKVADKHYRGTLDYTKTPAFAANSTLRSTLGDSAKAVPFEATVGDDGFLSTLDTTTTVNGTEVTQHMTFSGFGTKVTVAKPAPAEVTEAPERIYGLLGA
ncbi:hypothetical protein ACNTMW_07825 [Planosporangium sp. 12N6]|uniref:hypothetical protein n=1 Tax=Planosporangium spinosum TaxID=3402278 RepID=UPI003CF80920